MSAKQSYTHKCVGCNNEISIYKHFCSVECEVKYCNKLNKEDKELIIKWE